MEHSPNPKTMRVSFIQLAQMMMPEHANTHGNVHGGWLMKLVDETGALASTRHAAHLQVFIRNNGIGTFFLCKRAIVENVSISFTSG